VCRPRAYCVRARDAGSIAGPVKLKFFHLEGGDLNHLRDYQEVIDDSLLERFHFVSSIDLLDSLAAQSHTLVAIFKAKYTALSS
jgi:hypothetical protein